MSDPTRPSSPIPAYLTALAALIAATMPFTAYINGRYSLEVEREKFLTQIRLNYIDRAIDTNRDLASRESFMRFIVETSEPSDPLYRWASSEAKKASEVRKLQAAVASLDTKLQMAQFELTNAQNLHSSDRATFVSQEKQLADNVQAALREKSRLEKELRAAESRAGLKAASKVTRDPIVESIDTRLDGLTGQYVAEFTITGRNFGRDTGYCYLVFKRSGKDPHDEIPLKVVKWSDTSVRAYSIVPIWKEEADIFTNLVLTRVDLRSTGFNPLIKAEYR